MKLISLLIFLIVNLSVIYCQDVKTSTKVSTTNGDIILPKPKETKSVFNFSTVLGWTENSTPTAPAGFRVDKYSGSLKSPRWIYILPNGDVLVAEVKKEHKGLMKLGAKVIGKTAAESKSTNANQITLLRDTNSDGQPDIQQVFIANLDLPFGMLLLKDHFYVACHNAVWKYPYKTGQTELKDAGQHIIDLPAEGRHWTRNLIASPDGSKIYIAVGSGTNVAEDGMDKELLRANILEINPDGSGLKVYGAGLRNPVGMDFYPGSNTLWTVVNERDGLGDELVPDFLTSVKPGGFYGWPDCYFGPNLDERIKDPRMDLVRDAIIPDVPMGAHTGSLGLTFYDGKSFPSEFTNGAFVGQHGSWNKSVPSGYQVVFVPFKNGLPVGQPEPFLTGFMANPVKNEVYGRPVGIAVMPDGSLLVADDAGDAIWRVTFTK